MLQFFTRMSIWEPKKPRSDQGAFWDRKNDTQNCKNNDFASTKRLSTAILNEKTRNICTALCKNLDFFRWKLMSGSVSSKRNRYFHEKSKKSTRNSQKIEENQSKPQQIKENRRKSKKSKKINFSTGGQGVLHFLARMTIWESKKPRSDQWALWERK